MLMKRKRFAAVLDSLRAQPAHHSMVATAGWDCRDSLKRSVQNSALRSVLMRYRLPLPLLQIAFASQRCMTPQSWQGRWPEIYSHMIIQPNLASYSTLSLPLPTQAGTAHDSSASSSSSSCGLGLNWASLRFWALGVLGLDNCVWVWQLIHSWGCHPRIAPHVTQREPRTRGSGDQCLVVEVSGYFNICYIHAYRCVCQCIYMLRGFVLTKALL